MFSFIVVYHIIWSITPYFLSVWIAKFQILLLVLVDIYTVFFTIQYLHTFFEYDRLFYHVFLFILFVLKLGNWTQKDSVFCSINLHTEFDTEN